MRLPRPGDRVSLLPNLASAESAFRLFGFPAAPAAPAALAVTAGSDLRSLACGGCVTDVTIRFLSD